MPSDQDNKRGAAEQSRAYLRESLAALTRKPAILIVDDYAEDRFLLGHLLSKYNCEVSEFAGSEGAAELILSHSFDIVFLDVKLPPGDGIEVLKKVREEKPTQTVIVMTGYDDREIRERLLDLGPQLMWRKPIKAADIESIFGTLNAHA